MREKWCWPKRNRITRWEKEWVNCQHSITLQKTTKESRRLEDLNHVVQRDAGGAQWPWKKVTVVADSGKAENVMLRRMFPEISTEVTERSKNGERMQRTRRSTSSTWTAGHVRQNS